MGKQMQASALFVARVNASDMAIFSFLALSLSFTLAKNEAENWIFLTGRLTGWIF